jgi:hypothetical protein
MKNLCFIIVFLTSGSTNLFSQATHVISADTATYMSIHEDNLYFIVYNYGLLRFNLNDTLTLDTISISEHAGLAIVEDTLYTITTNGKIYRADLTEDSLNLIEITTVTPYEYASIAVNGTDIFFSTANNIQKIDLLNLNNPPEIVSPEPQTFGLICKSGYLYYSNLSVWVEMIDLSNPNYLIQRRAWSIPAPTGLYPLGDDLYIADYARGEILLSDVDRQLTDIAVGIEAAYGLAFDGNDLYCSAAHGGEIVKINIIPVATNSVKKITTWTVYPNPAQENLYFNGLEKMQEYEIIDALGRLIKQGEVAPNTSISVKSLASGTYFIRLENNELQKFIKE